MLLLQFITSILLVRRISSRDVTLTFGRWRKENYEDLSLNATNVHYAKWRMYWTSETYRALHLAAAGRVATGINWIVMQLF